MRLLLDTCTFLWVALEPDRIPKALRKVLQEPEHDVFLSAVSSMEIAVKFVLGKLELDERPSRWVAKWRELHGIESLSFEEKSALHVAELPPIHKDPFDRMLISQAIINELQIVTPDRNISQYGIKVIW